MSLFPPMIVQMALAVPAAGGPSFARVFEEHAPYVWRALRQLGVPESDAEDLSQDVFLVVHRKLAGFEGRSSLKTWLYGICIRVASDHRRSARVRREQVTDQLPERAGSAPQPDELERRQAKALLDRALDELGPDKRAAFVLYEIEQLTIAETAEAMGCPLQTAYSRLNAARREVRAAFEDAMGTGGLS